MVAIVVIEIERADATSAGLLICPRDSGIGTDDSGDDVGQLGNEIGRGEIARSGRAVDREDGGDARGADIGDTARNAGRAAGPAHPGEEAAHLVDADAECFLEVADVAGDLRIGDAAARAADAGPAAVAARAADERLREA